MTGSPPDKLASPSRARSWHTGLALLAILLLAAGLRCYHLGAEGYWIDELHALIDSAARQPELAELPHDVILPHAPQLTALSPDTTALDVWRTMRHETHPPLYFVLLHGWRRVVGDSEAAVRALPAALSVLSLLPVFLMLRAAGRPRAGVLTALLLAGAFSHGYLAQQNRQYSLALLAIGCVLWTWQEADARWSASRPRAAGVWLAGYALALLAAMLTHYLCALPLLAHALWAVFVSRGRFRWAWFAAAGAAAGVFLILWGPALLAQQERFAAAGDVLAENHPQHVLHTLIRLANLPSRLLIHTRGSNVDPTSVVPGLVFVAFVVAALCKAQPAHRRLLLLFALLYAVPAAVLTAVDLAASQGTLGHLRYPALGVIGLAGLIALTAEQFAARRPWLAPLLITGLAIAVAFPRYPTRRNPDAREAAAQLAAAVQPGDLVICDGVGQLPYWPSRLALLLGHYQPADAPSYPTLLLGQPPDADVLDTLHDYRRLFVISGWTDHPPWQPPPPFAHAEDSPWLWGLGPIRVYTRPTG